MLVIQEDQIEQLALTTRKRFEDEMLEHMAAFAPKLYEICGGDVFRTAIQHGIELAGSYGFTNRGPVRFYIESMFTLGCMFDTDPQYPWAGEILNDKDDPDQMRRADQLFDAMSKYFVEAIGPDHEYAIAALHRISNAGSGLLNSFVSSIESSVLSAIGQYYPEKAKVVGNDALETLVRSAKDVAQEHGITATNGVALICILTFIFGHGVVSDPLYPWIKKSMDKSQHAPQIDLIHKLAAKTWSYLGAADKYLS